MCAKETNKYLWKTLDGMYCIPSDVLPDLRESPRGNRKTP